MTCISEVQVSVIKYLQPYAVGQAKKAQSSLFEIITSRYMNVNLILCSRCFQTEQSQALLKVYFW
jgi:hypothetical protein